MRKIVALLIVSIVLIFNSPIILAENTTNTVQEDKTAATIQENKKVYAVKEINIENQDKGTVELSYKSDSGKRLKVLIEKDGIRYQYNLNNEGKTEVFPLQMGNGTYSISILENIEGNKYTPVYTETKELKLVNQNVVYLNSVQQITWNEESSASKLAEELTAGLETAEAKAKAIYNYVVNNYTYDYDKLANVATTYLPDADRMISEKTGICYDYSSLYAIMLRSIGIPAKLVKGYTPNVNGYHAWNEVYLSSSDKWVTVDTTYDAQMLEYGYSVEMEKNTEDYAKKYEY